MKTPKSDLKRKIAFGDGRTKQMYEFLAPIVGYHGMVYMKTFIGSKRVIPMLEGQMLPGIC